MQNLQVDGWFQYFFQIWFGELHDYVYGGEIVLITWHADLNQVDDAGVSEFSQQCDFPKNALAICFVLENIIHFFYGHSFPSRELYGLSNLSIRPLTK
jgi:hypothetical protein